MASLRKGIVVMVVGNGLFAASQFVMLMGLARLTTPETVGAYGLALAVTAPAYLFANLKLRQVAISDTADDYSSGQYVATRLLAVGAVWLFLAGVSAATFNAQLLLAVSTLKAFELVSDIAYAIPHRAGRLTGISISLSIRGVLGATTFLLCLSRGSSLEVAVWSTASIYGVGALCDCMLGRHHGDLRPTWEWPSIGSLLRLAAPLGLAMAVSSLGAMLPRYALHFTQGVFEVGIYTALAYVLVLGGLVINSVGQAASPHLAKQLAMGDIALFQTTVRRLRLFGLGLGLTGAAATLAVGEPLLEIVFGAAYASHSDALFLLMISAAITYATVFVGTALNALRRFALPLPITVVSVAAGAALLWPATQAWSIAGAAVASVVRALIELLLYERALRRQYAHPPSIERKRDDLSSSEGNA